MRLTPAEIEQIKIENSAYTEAWERGYKEGWHLGYQEGAARSEIDYFDAEGDYWNA